MDYKKQKKRTVNKSGTKQKQRTKTEMKNSWNDDDQHDVTIVVYEMYRR